MPESPLQSDHFTREPNEPVLLYEGPGEVSDSIGNTAEGDLRVTLDWLPSPRVVFVLESDTDSGINIDAGATLKLEDSRTMDGRFTGRNVSGGGEAGFSEEVRGVVSGEWGPDKPVAHVVFNVANLQHFDGATLKRSDGGSSHIWNGRLQWSSDQWTVTLDETEPSFDRLEDLKERLKRGGGYALTHTGKLERKDGASIGHEDFREVLAGLSQFFCFIAGANTGVVLPRGIGFDGETVWERWNAPTTEPWRGRISCFPDSIVENQEVRPPELEPVFRRFVDRWTDNEWRELLRYGVGWYMTINPHHNSETRIVLAQAGLELAAWGHFVPKRMSKSGFEKLPAVDRLRLLLTEAKVPLAVPAGLQALETYAPTTQGGKPPWDDGPQTLTEIRNLLVHPTKKLRALDIPPEVMRDTAELAVWYLQLALMFLLGYQDIYVSRVEGWNKQPVPWTVPPASP